MNVGVPAEKKRNDVSEFGYSPANGEVFLNERY